MNTVLMMSALSVWSMGAHKGAPSFYQTVRAYRDAGWRVVLVSATKREIVEAELPGVVGVQVRLGVDRLIAIRGLSLFARLYKASFGGFRLYFAGRRAIKKLPDVSVVYAYEVASVLPSRLLSRRYDVPLVTRFQGTILAGIKNSARERIRHYPHFHALASDSDLVIMTDDGTQGDKVLDLLGNQSPRRFWRNGVDRQNHDGSADTGALLQEALKASVGIDPSRRVILTLSRLAHWKRVDRAILATASLVQLGYPVSLVIVGEGVERENLEQLAASEGVQEYVHFVGSVRQEEVPRYLNIADIFLSLYDLSNLGNPLFEAMFAGRPLVTIDVGDTGRVIEDGENGLLVSKGTNDMIVSAIVSLLGDPEMAARLGRNAREWAAAHLWSWDQRMAEELRVVNELVLSSDD